MKKISVSDKTQIKQLLYCERVLGIRDDSFKSFCGFQLWWYDKQHNVCNSCESHWVEPAKRICHYSLDKAAGILWRKRKALFLRSRQLGSGVQQAGQDQTHNICQQIVKHRPVHQ